MIKKSLLFVWRIPRNLLILLVRVYQKFFSPDHSFWAESLFPGGYCKFTPTCSEYMILALHHYGVIRGIGKGFWRVFRCNPWSAGGEDLP